MFIHKMKNGIFQEVKKLMMAPSKRKTLFMEWPFTVLFLSGGFFT